jgi:RNA polymerase sigma-70 factor (ECF subfamily)
LAVVDMNRSQQTSRLPAKEAAERSLLERIAAADREALTDLYAQYHQRLFKFVYRLTRSHTMTDEVVNDIMLAVWRSAENYRGDSKPSTWIFGIAYRQSLKRLSRKQLKIAPQMDVEQIAGDAVHTVEEEDWIRHGLNTLPTTQRLAVELVFFLGLSYEEVAAVTECPVNTVKTRMFHARRKLKERLAAAAGEAKPGEAQ